MDIHLASDTFFHEILKSQTLLPMKENEIQNTIRITLQGIHDYEILKKDKTKFKKILDYYKKLKKITVSEQVVKHLTLHILKNVYEDNMIPPYEKLVENLRQNVKGLTIYNFVFRLSSIKTAFYKYNAYMNKIENSFQKNYKKLKNLSDNEIKSHRMFRKYFLLPGFKDYMKQIRNNTYTGHPINNFCKLF